MRVVDKLHSSGKSSSDGWKIELPTTGLGTGVLEQMKGLKQKDPAWQGKCSGTVFAHTNPLHLDVFKSVVRFEAEVVATTGALFGNKEKASGGKICGNMTSGGTESILMVVKSSLDYMKAKKNITCPEMCACFYGCFYQWPWIFGALLIFYPVLRKGVMLPVGSLSLLLLDNVPERVMVYTKKWRFVIDEGKP
ncbi:putative sphinganine-1-phosphate aldolase [Helianthus annuus]|nr:putative sphinganine-1-phosphate aldolase [Helianthus annuus]